MNFYSLEAYGWEESYKIVFYSDEKSYSQEEFEDLFFDAYHDYCKGLLSEDETCKCYPNLFFNVDDILTDDDFIEFFCNRAGLSLVSDGYKGRIVFSLKHNYNYKGKGPFSKRFYDTFNSIPLDDSCRDNCTVDDEFTRRHCLMFERLGFE